MTQYDETFYDVIAEGCIKSAAVVAPVVYGLFRPESVIDFGCGQGYWARAFADLGASVLGLDGAYVDQDHLAIPKESFRSVDFDHDAGLDFGEHDLAISLEVAEHVAPERADWFVAQICKHAEFVLFSAAIPAQGGTGHVNEQWPGYWAEKFRAHGYWASDALRWKFWNDAPERVENWYVQNMLLFAKPEVLAGRHAPAAELFQGPDFEPPAVVHPVLWGYYRGV